ncbi:glycosyltransferase [Oscillospiraceae bacterium MB08-C2-2]|nr:glycosyltransferase [Oscillospiraceae bacterium MB08-C2-2]
MAITISLCMIVKNEEEVLARCLDGASRFADEVVIVDTGSTDATKEVAAKYTDRIYDFEWQDDFSLARNYAFSLATQDYIMWLDADDIVDEENIAKILELKETLSPDVDAVMFLYNIAFDKQGKPTFHYYRERLAKRSQNFQWKEPVHEHLAVGGNIKTLDIAIIHGHKNRIHSDRNLHIYESILAKGEELSTRGCYYYARELMTHKRHRAAVSRYQMFLDRKDGWVEDKINACGDMFDCYAALNESDKAQEALYKSFTYDLPRPEICCRLGSLYMKSNRLEKAIFWYETALQLKPGVNWGFVREDYRGYIPHMQLCVCYDRIGNREKALLHHEAAKALRPNDPAVLFNENYFNPPSESSKKDSSSKE